MNLVLLSEVAEARAQSNLKADYCRETGFGDINVDLLEADFAVPIWKFDDGPYREIFYRRSMCAAVNQIRWSFCEISCSLSRRPLEWLF